MSLITHLETMVIDATLIGADVSPLTADGGMNKTQPSIHIGTSNTSVESASQWLGILWSCDGDKTAFKRLSFSFELILLDDLLYKIAQQDTHHQLIVQRATRVRIEPLQNRSSNKIKT